MKFLNAELGWAGALLSAGPRRRHLDMARAAFPARQNSLDALCRRFGVDNSARSFTARCSTASCWRRSTWS
jgi:DNA polymerase III subunit epsilon